MEICVILKHPGRPPAREASAPCAQWAPQVHSPTLTGTVSLIYWLYTVQDISLSSNLGKNIGGQIKKKKTLIKVRFSNLFTKFIIYNHTQMYTYAQVSACYQSFFKEKNLVYLFILRNCRKYPLLWHVSLSERSSQIWLVRTLIAWLAQLFCL